MASAAEQLAANLNFGAFAKADELKKRIWFTLGALVIYRLGTYIPLPGMNPDAVADLFRQTQSGMLGMFNMFSGGAVGRLAIFALAIMPYISASIIVQLLSSVVPSFEALKKEGEQGRKTLNQYTRYLTLVLAVFQAYAIGVGLQGSGNLVLQPGPFFLLSTTITLVGGTMFLLWLGEQISEKGIGNGTSLLIFAGIILSLPNTVEGLGRGLKDGAIQWWSIVLVLAIFLAVTWLVVYFTTAQRRIPVQHMRRMVGTKMMGGQTSYLPFPVNSVGVIPIIFAVALLGIPSQLALMVGPTTPVGNFLQTAGLYLHPALSFPEGLIGIVLYTAMIFFFSYFWTAIQFNVEDISNNLKRGNSYIPGVRPGKQTKEFLDGVISRITVVGALLDRKSTRLNSSH